ncbi:hypothetical protein WN48_10378 [Eufriesea mexicana]|nr:hypothetical protein WN48_10378 [Eufriesea mexicana]
MELVVFQYMLIVLAQLLTVESRTVCRQTKNTKVTKDVETMVTTWTNEQRAPRHHCSPRYNDQRTNDDNNQNNNNYDDDDTCTFLAVVHNHLPPPLHPHRIHTSLNLARSVLFSFSPFSSPSLALFLCPSSNNETTGLAYPRWARDYPRSIPRECPSNLRRTVFRPSRTPYAPLVSRCLGSGSV